MSAVSQFTMMSLLIIRAKSNWDKGNAPLIWLWRVVHKCWPHVWFSEYIKLILSVFTVSFSSLNAGRSRCVRCSSQGAPGGTEVCIQLCSERPAPGKDGWVDRFSFVLLPVFIKVWPLGWSAVEQKNPLLQLKQCGVGIGVGRVKRRYKRKNAISPLKKGTSPLKRRQVTNSPAKATPPPVKSQEPINVPKVNSAITSLAKLKSFFFSFFFLIVADCETRTGIFNLF